MRLTQMYLRSSLLYTSKVTGKFLMQRSDDRKYVYFHRLSCQQKNSQKIGDKNDTKEIFFWMFT